MNTSLSDLLDSLRAYDHAGDNDLATPHVTLAAKQGPAEFAECVRSYVEADCQNDYAQPSIADINELREQFLADAAA